MKYMLIHLLYKPALYIGHLKDKDIDSEWLLDLPKITSYVYSRIMT